MRKCSVIILLMGTALMLSGLGLAWAQEAAAGQTKKEETKKAEADNFEEAFTVENVSGEVSWISKDTVSLVYDRNYDTGTEYEIVVPVDKKTAIRHKKSLNEIKVSDLVSIEYEKPAKGSKKAARAITITFIQTGVTALISGAADETQDSAETS